MDQAVSSNTQMKHPPDKTEMSDFGLLLPGEITNFFDPSILSAIDEEENDQFNQNEEILSPNTKILLNLFTRPVDHEETFFQRVKREKNFHEYDNNFDERIFDLSQNLFDLSDSYDYLSPKPQRFVPVPRIEDSFSELEQGIDSDNVDEDLDFVSISKMREDQEVKGKFYPFECIPPKNKETRTKLGIKIEYAPEALNRVQQEQIMPEQEPTASELVKLRKPKNIEPTIMDEESELSDVAEDDSKEDEYIEDNSKSIPKHNKGPKIVEEDHIDVLSQLTPAQKAAKAKADNTDDPKNQVYFYTLMSKLSDEHLRLGVEYLKLAVQKEYPIAIYKYAKYCTDIEEKTFYMKKAADTGNPEALYQYAKLIENKDPEGFLHCMKISCEMNCHKALYQYPKLIEETNPEEAAKYYRIGAHTRVSQREAQVAMYNYGMCLKYGKGVKKDERKAAEYLKKAADAKIKNALFEYGLCLKDGIGVEKDYTKAAFYFGQVKARSKISEEARKMQKLCERLEKDYIIRTTVRLRNADRMKEDNEYMYLQPLSVRHSNIFSLSKQDIKKLADRGNAEAQVIIGKAFLEGGYFVINETTAAFYFKLAADQNNMKGLYYYGRCLIFGEGVVKNLIEGKQYIKISAACGYQKAVRWISSDYQECPSSSEDEEVNDVEEEPTLDEKNETHPEESHI